MSKQEITTVQKQEVKDFVDKEFAFLLELPISDRHSVRGANWYIIHTTFCNGEETNLPYWDNGAPKITVCNYREKISGFAATIREIVEQNRLVFLRTLELQFNRNEVELRIRIGFKQNRCDLLRKNITELF